MLLEIVSDWSFLVEDVFEFDILLLILSTGTEYVMVRVGSW